MKKMLARRVKWIYLATLLLSLHYAFTIYINSSFLSQYFTEEKLSLLYALGASITILILIASSSIIKKITTGRFLLLGVFLEMCALIGMYTSQNVNHIALFFIVHQALPPVLLFGLDVFLEDTLRTEEVTGKIRSNYLTIINVAFVLSPLVVGRIIQMGGYRTVYLISAMFCLLLFFIVGDELQPVKMRSLEETSFFDSIRKIIPRPGLRVTIFIDFLLQCFYVLMVIYMPLYLHEYIGFNWDVIGVLFTIMLVPFVLFEAPLGRLFDRRKVEVDTIVSGFFIMIIALVTMAITQSNNPVVWAILLFVSRIGASFIEVSAEYSFFKRVSGRDAGFISMFRMTGPFAYALVPFIARAVLPVLLLQGIFMTFSIVLVLGIFYAFILRTLKR